MSTNDINAIEEKYGAGLTGTGSSKSSYSHEEKIYRSKETSVKQHSSSSSSKSSISSSKSSASKSGSHLDEYFDDEDYDEYDDHTRRKRSVEKRVEPTTMVDRNGVSELVVVFVS